MNAAALVVLGTSLAAYGLVSARVGRSSLTAPLVFVALGLLAGPAAAAIVDVELGHGVIEVLAEITLVLVLFADAARIDTRRLRSDHTLPLRMLIVGLPLTILFGGAVAVALFPEFGWPGALVLAAVLAPTDAALGQAVVTARSVPVRIRQAINVESGLNDGIALPAVLIFVSMASSGSGEGGSIAGLLRLGAIQIALAPVVGVLIGAAGGRLLDRAASAGLSTRSFEGIVVLSLALLSFGAAEAIGANGFIAAFAGGLTFGAVARDRCSALVEFMETEGQLLTLVTFFVFGAALLSDALPLIDARAILYASLSLTVIRMAPVAVSLIGSGVSVATSAFLGWFGPRGLASILFALLIVRQAGFPHQEAVLAITVTTVALSVVLHGVSAAPLGRVYAARVARQGKCQETVPVVEMPLRFGNDSPGRA